VTASPHPHVQREEAAAVAAALGQPPEGLVAIKMQMQDGGGNLEGRPPKALLGFSPGRPFGIDYPDSPSGPMGTRAAVRYDAPEGTLIIVGHETGAAIWAWVEHTATVVGLVGGVKELATWMRAGRAPEQPNKVKVGAGGNIKSSEPWDEQTL
jgi:hypothetical protein